MKLTVPPLPIEPNEGFTPEKDIFGRKDFGQNLLNLITNIDDELVIALDAPWGEGKTTFIKMWQGMLAKEEIKSIYFDAFANDYQKEPFLAIAAEIYGLIKKETEGDKTKLDKFKDKTTSVIKTLGRAGLRIGIKAATAGVLDDTIFEDTNTIKDFGKEASDLLDNMDFKIKTENERISMQLYQDLAIYYNISLREIERSLSNYALGYNTIDDLKLEYNIILVYLSIVKTIFPAIFKHLSHNSIAYIELEKQGNLESFLNDDSKNYENHTYTLEICLRCCLSTQEELKIFLEQHKNNDYIKNDIQKNDQKIIENICIIMNNIKLY